MHRYYPKNGQRADANSSKYDGPKSEIYRRVHKQRMKSKKLPVWMTHKNVGKNDKIKGDGRTRIDFRKLKVLHH